jgi:hypothetical protein
MAIIGEQKFSRPESVNDFLRSGNTQIRPGPASPSDLPPPHLKKYFKLRSVFKNGRLSLFRFNLLDNTL